ncbi:MAG: SdrD B-like domain-containing protein, partial [Candidatus Thorarchaeota archaeon]
VSLGSDGCYVFTGQEPGSVTVTEDLDSAWYPLNATSWTMDMESGKTYIVRFVNFKKASKSGYKWHDLNGNGIWECDEPAMDGWTINLYQEIDSEWVFLRLAVTGLGEWPDGYYNFSGLEPGEYKVNETLETGWTRTYPISGEYTFTATSGFVELNNNFGNFKWFTISGYKYEYFEGFSDNFDELDFETWSKSEEDNSWWLTPEGWLYSDGTTEWARIFADPTMSLNDYVFEVDVNLIRGSGWEVLFRVNDENYYSLQYEAHCGAVLHLRKYTGSSFEELDQPVSFAPDYDWHHIKVRVLEGYIRIHIDGVLVFNVTDTTDPYLSGGIGLGVLEDARAYFDNVRVLPIVNVLEGWTINLYRDGSLIPYATDTTDEFGFYNFTVEDPGHYTVAEVLLPDWSAVLPVLHIPEISGEEVAGYSIDAISGKNISCRDFWNFKWFTITVEKFQDITGNGILGDDPHLGGWTFYLDNGTIVTSHSDEDENGIVEIDIKRPGSYILTEDLQYGWTQTGTESYPFNAESGMITDPFIFLNFKNVDITVCKLEDANGNLESTDDQEPVSGWTVYLYKDDGAEPIDTQETTCCGCYTWENLGPGSYRVEELVPWGWTALTLISHEFGRVESGESYRFDFINFKWFTVTVYKYEDRTGDGYSDDDTLLSGWTFYLDDGTTKLPFDDEDDGFIDGIASILVTQPGHYEVTEQLEDDYTQTGIEIYEFDAKSGIDVGAEDPDRFIFTNFKWFKIWGHKYEDWDGTQESTERPLDGWRIELWIYNEDLGYYIFKEPTMTAENPEVAGDYGYYEFLVMEPGKYQIKEVLEIGWVETAPMSAYGPGPVLGYDLGLVISGVDLENKDFWNAGLRTYITDTSDCRNIVTDFRLVVTPDFKTGEELYKVSATNPGGFYFNFIFHSWTDDEMKIYFDLAEEFIVKGGQPIHAYIWTDANSNGLVDWCDDELEGIHKNKLIEIDYGEGFIIFEDIEPCNDILVTIHMSFNKKEYQSKEKEWFEDNLLGKGYEFKAHVDGSWSSTTTLTETSEEVKKLKACAVYGIVLEEADDDVPVSGASFSLYKDETLLKSMTTGDDGIFYFDKLDEGTYTLGIELPLGLILQDEKYSGTVIYLSIQIKLQKGDFIFAYVFIRTDAADPGEDPYVTTSMEHINIPESSSSSSYPGNHRDPFRDPEDYDYGVVVEPVLEQKVASSNLEIPILLTWFASVFSLASIFTARKIRRKGASKLYQIAEWDIGFECTFQNSEKQLEWAFEKDGSNLEPGWEKRFAWIRDCSRQLSFNPFIDEEDDNSSK